MHTKLGPKLLTTKSLRWSWFWKTLTGYTVTFINLDYEHVVTHRPFRQPLMESTRMTKKPLKGKAYEMIIYDEALLLTPEQLDKLTDLELDKPLAKNKSANPPSKSSNTRRDDG